MVDTPDTEKLEREVKRVYRSAAHTPGGDQHFEMGRALAERLGYPPEDLDQIPTAAVESFAGVGYHLDTAGLAEGDAVLDLGCGSGTDAFVAALYVGDAGRVTGVDMTDAQVAKARRLRDETVLDTVTFELSYIEDLPFDDGTFDVVISNGVINLSPEKDRVFEEANRVLTAGGRLAVSDIVSELPMPDSIKSDADLWAACIGGAMQRDRYLDVIETRGFDVVDVRENPQYVFTSDQAASACEQYGVRSISLGARKRR